MEEKKVLKVKMSQLIVLDPFVLTSNALPAWIDYHLPRGKSLLLDTKF